MESFHINPACSQKDQKLTRVDGYGLGLIFGHNRFLGVGFVGESSVRKQAMKKSCILQYAMLSDSTVPGNYQSQFIYKNQTRGNPANSIS